MMHRLSDIERQRIRVALIEDGALEDVTTLATAEEGLEGLGTFLAKANGVLAGLNIAEHCFAIYEDMRGVASPIFEFKSSKQDGNWVTAGETIATIRASLPTLLAAERLALNFLQRMSGIATATRSYVDAVEGTGAVILDTRKTAPLLRPFDRLAVKLGGGSNHRYSLRDMILIKDNHIAINGGDVRRVLDRVRSFFELPEQKRVPVEIEVTSLPQLEEVLRFGMGVVDRVMFDNFPLDPLREAVALNHGIYETEASGGVMVETVRLIAETGVNYISVGALTHSVKALDISLEIEPL